MSPGHRRGVAGPKQLKRPSIGQEKPMVGSGIEELFSGVRTATHCQPKQSRLGSGTASATAIEGSGIAGSNPRSSPSKPASSCSVIQTMGGVSKTVPEVLGRNGTCVLRKLHQRVATFRRYLKENSKGPEVGVSRAAKMMGRWPSRHPWRSARFRDDQELGASTFATTTFLFGRTRPGTV